MNDSDYSPNQKGPTGVAPNYRSRQLTGADQLPDAGPDTSTSQGMGLETMSTIVRLPNQQTHAAKASYLNSEYGLKSWLLTGDHKRIAMLYLISITFFFFIGGAFAGLIRLELLTPMPDLVASDTYNKLFTMHGIIMVFLFLVPSVPATVGNFVHPHHGRGAMTWPFPRSTC